MSQTFTTKALSFGFAAMVTLAIMMSLDALASSEQANVFYAGQTMTQTACLDASRDLRS